ncbi:MAG: DUF1801 domain-containing protein [Anaerolineales bacterium]|nr:DUF1801 domain-containing protein [Anaerolineales bacterium]
MKPGEPIPQDIETYVRAFPPDVQAVLRKIRAAIRKAAPDGREAIKYQLPTFTLFGRNLVHYGAFRRHIGFYPTPSGTSEFRKELLPYPVSKGAVQFPLDKPIPFGLIEKIVRFRVKEERERADRKTKKGRGRTPNLSS